MYNFQSHPVFLGFCVRLFDKDANCLLKHLLCRTCDSPWRENNTPAEFLKYIETHTSSNALDDKKNSDNILNPRDGHYRRGNNNINTPIIGATNSYSE